MHFMVADSQDNRKYRGPRYNAPLQRETATCCVTWKRRYRAAGSPARCPFPCASRSTRAFRR